MVCFLKNKNKIEFFIFRGLCFVLEGVIKMCVCVVGTGSVGLGFLNMAIQVVSRMTGLAANPQFFLTDKCLIEHILLALLNLA